MKKLETKARELLSLMTIGLWAANEGHLEVVRLLLKHGADKYMKSDNGYTAESIARENGHYQIAELLRKGSY